MVWRVATAGREVHEEGLVRVLRPDPVKPFDRIVGHGVREVVRVVFVVEARRGANDLLVLDKAGVPLAGVPCEEAVEVVEAPAGRPPVERTGRTLHGVRCEMPLAICGGAVAVVPKDPGERGAVSQQRCRVAGKASRELPDPAESHTVVVPSGQQSGARRRAQRRDVEPVEAHAPVGDPGVVGRVDRSAERAWVPEAGVVDKDEQHVRCSIRRRGVTIRFQSGSEPSRVLLVTP